MKWVYVLSVIALLHTAGNAQEFSLNIPVLEGFFDAAIQVVELPAGGYLLSTPNGCREDAPTTNCAGLLRINEQGGIIWSKVLDGDNVDEIAPAQFGIALANNTIYIANLISQGNQKQARLMALNLEGHLLYQQDLAIPYTSSLLLEGML